LRLATVTQERPSPAGVKEPTYDVAISFRISPVSSISGKISVKRCVILKVPQNPRREGSFG